MAVLRPCRRPPRKDRTVAIHNQQRQGHNYLEAIAPFTSNQLIYTISDTAKVTIQRIAILHILFARVANSMFSELTGPGHMIAGSTASSISTAKNDIMRLLAQVKILLEAYKRQEGGPGFTEADHHMTDYEFVMNYLPLIDANIDEFKRLAERIGAKEKLWKTENEKTSFMALFEMDICEVEVPLEQQILGTLIALHKARQGILTEEENGLFDHELILQNLDFVKRNQKALKKLGMEIAQERSWFTKDQEKKAFASFLDDVLDIKKIRNEINQQKELRAFQLTLLNFYREAHQEHFNPVGEALALSDEDIPRYISLISRHKDEFKAIALQLGPTQKWWKNEDQKKVFMLLFEPNITKILKQLKAVYFHSLIKSMYWTAPVGLLIAIMPYLLNASGNSVLMSEKWIAGIFALAPLSTVSNSMNSSLVTIFASYLQYRLTTISVVLRDIPQVTCSLLGWHYQSPYLIAIGQAIPSAVCGALGTYSILNQLNKIPSHLPLSESQKSRINQRINRNIMGVIATAGFRFLIPLILALQKAHSAILAYNIFYTLVWGFLGFPRSISQTYTFGRGQHAYDGNEEPLGTCLARSNTLLTVFLAVIEFSIRDNMIDWINDPTTPEAIEANNFSRQYWLIGCITMGLLGWSYVNQDKIGNAYDHRVLLAAINLLPQIIGFFAPFYWGGDAQVIGISIGWLVSAVLSIVIGSSWKALTGPTPQPLAQGKNGGRPRTPGLTNSLSRFSTPLLNHHGDEEEGEPEPDTDRKPERNGMSAHAIYDYEMAAVSPPIGGYQPLRLGDPRRAQTAFQRTRTRPYLPLSQDEDGKHADSEELAND